jgi:hypothetical protein
MWLSLLYPHLQKKTLAEQYFSLASPLRSTRKKRATKEIYENPKDKIS